MICGPLQAHAMSIANTLQLIFYKFPFKFSYFIAILNIFAVTITIRTRRTYLAQFRSTEQNHYIKRQQNIKLDLYNYGLFHELFTRLI